MMNIIVYTIFIYEKTYMREYIRGESNSYECYISVHFYLYMVYTSNSQRAAITDLFLPILFYFFFSFYFLKNNVIDCKIMHANFEK